VRSTSSLKSVFPQFEVLENSYLKESVSSFFQHHFLLARSMSLLHLHVTPRKKAAITPTLAS